jgi:pyruvate/2-oxoacid:ferredoxin oxidoreductase beta subunit
MAVKDYLIEYTDVISAGNVSANSNKATIDKIIKVAQNQDIKPAIGADLLIKLLVNPLTDTDLLNLYNGCSYVVSAVTYSHSGVKEACKYYSLARLIGNNPVQVTGYSVVNKTADESQKVDKADILWQINNNNKIASDYMKETLHFLASFPLIYTTYVNTNLKTRQGTVISSIGD